VPQTPDSTSVQSVLLGDVVRALTLTPRDNGTRRAALLALCSAIEGILWTLQSELLTNASQELSTSQRAILRESPHIIRENGKVGRVPSKVNLKRRLQFSAAIVAALRPECGIPFTESGWKDLLATLDIRDRLAHPERPSDLDVTDAELEAAQLGEVWFLDNIVAVVQSEPRAVSEDSCSVPSLADTRCLASVPPLSCCVDTE